MDDDSSDFTDSELDQPENPDWRDLAHPQKVAFLVAYANCGVVTMACQAAEVGRRTHYHWLKNDADYRIAFDEANEMAIELMESEARKRATIGWNEPVFHMGAVCGHKRKFSDNLLMFMLKGAKPEKYRDRIEHTGAGGGPMEHRVETIAKVLQEVRDDPAYAKVRRAAAIGHSCQPGVNGAHCK